MITRLHFESGAFLLLETECLPDLFFMAFPVLNNPRMLTARKFILNSVTGEYHQADESQRLITAADREELMQEMGEVFGPLRVPGRHSKKGKKPEQERLV